MTGAIAERQKTILKAIREGIATNDDLYELYQSVKRLCWGIAYKYQARLRCPDEIEDLMQEAFFAVQDAAETYNPEEGKTFPQWLIFYLHRFYSAYIAAQDGRGINASQLSFRISQYEAEHFSLFGQRPSDYKLCKKFEVTPHELATIRAAGSGLLSLDQEDKDGFTLLDRIDQNRVSECRSLEDEVIDKIAMEEASEKLYEYINELNHDEREAIIIYYFHNLPDRECAEIMGYSHNSFTSLRYKALQKLRSANHRAALKRLLPDWLGSKPYHSAGRWLSSTERAAIQLYEAKKRSDSPC